jgi:hypothetical protein
MADSDFLSYSSIYDTFSKGPKSIYYGIGDEMLPGAILNVAQTDEDDEWGRTQRITDERTYDFIAKIYKSLFDPYNSISDISLVPGEAGSEINIAKNIIRLVGRAGIDTGVFDLSVPSMTLCGVTINGADNNILIGNGFEATETSLSLDSFFDFYVEQSARNKGVVEYKNVSTTWYDGSDGIRKFIIKVDNVEYMYGTDESGNPLFQLPSGGTLQTRGDLKTNNIIPNGNVAYDIGTSTLRYKGIYAGTGSFVGTLTTANLEPVTNITSDIGSDAKKYLTIYSNHMYSQYGLYSSSTGQWYLCGPNLNIKNTISGDVVMEVKSTGAILRTDLETRSLVADLNYAHDIGSETVRYANIYGAHIRTRDGLFSDSMTQWFICGPNLKIRNSISGEDTMEINVTGAKLYTDLQTRSLVPDLNYAQDIGTESTQYDKIFGAHIRTRDGLFSDLTTQWFLCGPNLKIRNSISGDYLMEINVSDAKLNTNLQTRSLLPDLNYAQDIGTESTRYANIFGSHVRSRDGLFSDSTTAWFICGPNMQILVGGFPKIGVCASYIEMYNPLYTDDIYPMSYSGKHIGSVSSGGFEFIYLNDQVTGAPRRVSVSSGVLVVS